MIDIDVANPLRMLSAYLIVAAINKPPPVKMKWKEITERIVAKGAVAGQIISPDWSPIKNTRLEVYP